MIRNGLIAVLFAAFVCAASAELFIVRVAFSLTSSSCDDIRTFSDVYVYANGSCVEGTFHMCDDTKYISYASDIGCSDLSNPTGTCTVCSACNCQNYRKQMDAGSLRQNVRRKGFCVSACFAKAVFFPIASAGLDSFFLI